MSGPRPARSWTRLRRFSSKPRSRGLAVFLSTHGLHGHKTWNRAVSLGLIAGFLAIFLVAGKFVAMAGLAVAWAMTFPLAIVFGKGAGAFFDFARMLAHTEINGPGWGAITFGLVYVGASLAFHRQIIRGMTGSRTADRRDHKRLYNIVENLAITAGMPTPAIEIINDNCLNAYASGLSERNATIAVTTGLVECLDDRELSAVIAHEISHIKNGDMSVTMMVSLLGGVATHALRRIWQTAAGPSNSIEAMLGTAGGAQSAELAAFMQRLRHVMIFSVIVLVALAAGALQDGGAAADIKGAASGGARIMQTSPYGLISFWLFGSLLYLLAVEVKSIKLNGSFRRRYMAMMLLPVAMVYAFALRIQSLVSRTRELVADAGAVELTKDPDALVSALAKIHGNDQLAGVHRIVDAMLISSPDTGWDAIHPSFEERVAALTAHAGALGLAIAQRTNLRIAAGRKEVATKLGPAVPVIFGRRAARPVVPT